MRTRHAWHAAVRHTGLLFQLPTSPSPLPSAHNPFAAATATPSKTDPPRSASLTGPRSPDASHAEATKAEDGAWLQAAAELPYPQLAQTVSSASFAPAAHLAEHYSPPGGTRASCLCTVLLHICICMINGLCMGACDWRASMHVSFLAGLGFRLKCDWLGFGQKAGVQQLTLA